MNDKRQNDSRPEEQSSVSLPTRHRLARWVFAAFIAIALAIALLILPRASLDEQFAEALKELDIGDLDRVAEIEAVLDADASFRGHAAFLRGAVFLRRKNFATAIDEFALVIPEGTLRQPTLELTGECLYRTGRLVEAESMMRQLATENPGNANAHRWLGAIYYDLGANDLAINELETVARLDPLDYKPHRLIGLMNLDFEMHQPAIDHYQKALARKPPRDVRRTIVLELSKSLVANRDFEAALRTLDELKDDTSALPLLSECNWSLGRREQADQLLDKALRLNPKDRSVLFLKARMLIGDGSWEAAIEPLTKISRQNPHDAECQYQLSVAYQRLGRTEEYESAFSQWNESKSLWNRLTELNIQAIQRPGDASVRDGLATICEKLGKHELSAMWRQAADACRKLSGANAPSESNFKLPGS